MVAIGIDARGSKIVLGLVQGATENATVVSGLLDQLATRGLDFSQPRLYLLDGGKALHKAITRHAGDAAFFQRCQVHKIRTSSFDVNVNLTQLLTNLPALRINELSAWLPDQWKSHQAA